MLEQTIFKIGTLLQKGFGELGAVIVTNNMNQEAVIDLEKLGNRSELIFCICRIKQFPDTTDCL